MKFRSCKCGSSMAPTTLVEDTEKGTERTTLWSCNWCLNEEQEKTLSVDPTTLPPATADAASVLRGFVRVDQVIQGPKGGKIYRRMW